ncbi:MAG: sigma-70 family RNA polymerase sigma factor [Phycisphaeraceae bacterium]|nr:MAG: sigma-70 family RNA polymerase sigma factor [Phycisphaeraceae bacterium]
MLAITHARSIQNPAPRETSYRLKIRGAAARRPSPAGTPRDRNAHTVDQGCGYPGDRKRESNAPYLRRSQPIASPQRQPASYRLVDDRSDEQLLADYRRGDVPAFRVLMERYHDELLRFLNRFMGDRQAAEDVFQDTFLQIHQSADSFDVSRRFKPWLFTIAANKGRDQHRKTSRRPVLGLSARIGGDEGQQFVDLMEVSVPAPSAAMDESERDRQVQKAIDSLPDHQREILLLAYFQRMTYAQIAELLEIPLGTVKSRLHAAVAGFARRWQSLAEETGESPTD